jgi:hypothetical protein
VVWTVWLPKFGEILVPAIAAAAATFASVMFNAGTMLLIAMSFRVAPSLATRTSEPLGDMIVVPLVEKAWSTNWVAVALSTDPLFSITRTSVPATEEAASNPEGFLLAV